MSWRELGKPAKKSKGEHGFTLVEVMIALSILFAGLMVLIRATSASLRNTQRAEMLGVATDLARGKMYDIEEELAREGFGEIDQTLAGTFDDEGWRQVAWKAEIVKVELPALGALQALEGGDKEKPSTTGERSGGSLRDLLGSASDGLDPQSMMEMGLIQSQYQLIAQVMEAAIRKVTLTATWEVVGEKESLTVVAYFTDPAAIKRVVPTAGAGALPPPGGQP